MPGLREPWHWLVLIIVLVLVFGAARLPMIAKNIGQSMKVFRKEIKDGMSSDTNSGDTPDDTNAK